MEGARVFLGKDIKAWVRRLSAGRHTIHTAPEPKVISEFMRRLRPVVSEKPLIRCGGALDGGYLVPDDLEGVTHCISPGVSTEISFDEDMAARGMRILMADASVDGPPRDHPNFRFWKKHLGVENDDRTITLESLCDQAGPPGGDLILQMDIEGAEYPVLIDASSETLSRFRIMLIEFHQFQHLNEPMALRLMTAVFSKLMKTHYVAHLQVNNVRAPELISGVPVSSTIELTFHRRDRVESLGGPATLPHPLDRDCVPGNPPAVIPDYWR